jgi:hypothetical protein
MKVRAMKETLALSLDIDGIEGPLNALLHNHRWTSSLGIVEHRVELIFLAIFLPEKASSEVNLEPIVVRPSARHLDFSPVFLPFLALLFLSARRRGHGTQKQWIIVS